MILTDREMRISLEKRSFDIAPPPGDDATSSTRVDLKLDEATGVFRTTTRGLQQRVDHGPLPIVLRIGMSVCQLILEQTLGVPERGYQGRFAGQRGS